MLVLFGCDPIKLRSDYAKFELEEPRVNITLNQFRLPQKGGVVNHFGIQVKSSDQVLQMKNRCLDAGFTLEEEVATCVVMRCKPKSG